MHGQPSPMRHAQRGAALLAAMLTVVLVATFAAAALWQQWRSVEIERAERARVQAAWILVGALDWSRLILREDSRAGGADYLAEPWAVPLQEARLSTFLAAENNVASVDDAAAAAQNAFLSGQIVDLQSRLNVYNLRQTDSDSKDDLLAFQRLFETLGLPAEELEALVGNMRRAIDQDSEDAPLMPQRFEQLTWLGLSPATVQRLAPYATLLPLRLRVNLNTASPEVIMAVVPGIDMAAAQKLVAARQANHFRSLPDAAKLLGDNIQLSSDRCSIASQYFEVRGRLRLDDTLVQERSVVQRNGLLVTTLWRERTTLPAVEAAEPLR
jgi:general secretion pathway protein K